MNAVTRLAAAKRAHQKPGDERAGARDDARTAGAEPDRGRADMGREQLRQIDRIAREYAEDEKPTIGRILGYEGSNSGMTR
jgi:hypothetical protein